jgi:hypothetical protein
VRGFLDANVLASAFGARGPCTDVPGPIPAEHEPVSGEVVIGDLPAVLRKKSGVPAKGVRRLRVVGQFEFRTCLFKLTR